MDLRKITAELSVAPQITEADVAGIVEAGFKSMICNRPNNEEPGQPAFGPIEAAAKAAGLNVVFMPVVSGQMTQTNVEEFGQLLQDLPAPVLAYCRTGTRCAILWGLSQAGKRPATEIIEAAAGAGYDLSGLAPQIT